MKIKVTIKKDSAAAKVVNAFKAQKEAFKRVVQSGKAGGYDRTKSRKVASV
jgi:hypothetical protein